MWGHVTGPVSGSTRLASAPFGICAAPPRMAARWRAAFDPSPNGPGPFCPARPESRGPQAKGNDHDKRTLRHSPAHHRQDRQRHRARRREYHAPGQRRFEKSLSRQKALFLCRIYLQDLVVKSASISQRSLRPAKESVTKLIRLEMVASDVARVIKTTGLDSVMVSVEFTTGG